MKILFIAWKWAKPSAEHLATYLEALNSAFKDFKQYIGAKGSGTSENFFKVNVKGDTEKVIIGYGGEGEEDKEIEEVKKCIKCLYKKNKDNEILVFLHLTNQFKQADVREINENSSIPCLCFGFCGGDGYIYDELLLGKNKVFREEAYEISDKKLFIKDEAFDKVWEHYSKGKSVEFSEKNNSVNYILNRWLPFNIDLMGVGEVCEGDEGKAIKYLKEVLKDKKVGDYIKQLSDLTCLITGKGKLLEVGNFKIKPISEFIEVDKSIEEKLDIIKKFVEGVKEVLKVKSNIERKHLEYLNSIGVFDTENGFNSTFMSMVESLKNKLYN